MDLLTELSSLDRYDILHIFGLYIICTILSICRIKLSNKIYSTNPPHGPIISSFEILWELIKYDIIFGFIGAILFIGYVKFIVTIIFIALKLIPYLILITCLMIYICNENR